MDTEFSGEERAHELEVLQLSMYSLPLHRAPSSVLSRFYRDTSSRLELLAFCNLQARTVPAADSSMEELIACSYVNQANRKLRK